MKVAIIGGTGKLGVGLARQLKGNHEVYIGSRDKEKAQGAADSVSGVIGGESLSVASLCDAAILTIPFAAVASLAHFEGALAGKLVISPIVPMKVENGTFYYDGRQGSAAEAVASRLPRSRVAAALHTLPAGFLGRSEKLDVDVLVAADDRKTYQEAAGIVGSIGKVRPLYAGPLSAASSVERLTPLLLNLARQNGIKTPSVRFVE